MGFDRKRRQVQSLFAVFSLCLSLAGNNNGMPLVMRRLLTAICGLNFLFLVGTVLAHPDNVRGSTLIVTTTADSGAGSLRQAIADVNDGDEIQFDPALNGQTISLTGGELSIGTNVNISGPGPTMLTVSRASEALFGIFLIMPDHTVVIEGLTIKNGAGQGGGGGIANLGATLTINNCIVKENIAFRSSGGGIYNDDQGTLTISNTIVSHNLATTDLFFNGGSAGGILNYGTLTITNSTISSNATANVEIPIGHGGGIWNVGGIVEITNSAITLNNANAAGGGIVNAGSLTITNSTISGNFVNHDGGGIATGGPLTIRNSTISGNSANGVGGGIWNTGNNAALEIANTILNTGTAGANLVNDSGTVTSYGYNLSNDNGGGFLTGPGDQINTTPMLGPLQDNGGPTFTHELLIGSPAINAGDPNFTPPPDFDQRGSGFLRVYDVRIDIGSLELQPTPPPPTPTPTPLTPTPTATATATPTSTATATPTATPTFTPPPTATPTPTPVWPVQFGNISTRLKVGTGDNVLIGGFIVTGTQSKKIILRAIGPSLPLAGTLADPVLELRNSSGGLIASNDNWRSDQEAEIIATGIPPGNDLESAIVATLPANSAAYTAIVHGANNGIGIGVVEVYDLDRTVDSKLANISTRGFVQTGDDVLIGGLIVLGQNPLGVIVRAMGPSLPLPGTLGDPTLELHDGNGALVAANDNWRSDQEAEIIATGIPPSNDLESAIVRNLASGNYTAIVRGVNNMTGIAVVEAYALN
jgi:hypothetical protein